MKFKDGKTISAYVRSKLHSSYITIGVLKIKFDGRTGTGTAYHLLGAHLCPLLPNVPEVFAGDVIQILLPTFHQILWYCQSSVSLLSHEASHLLVTLKGKNRYSVKMYLDTH